MTTATDPRLPGHSLPEWAVALIARLNQYGAGIPAGAVGADVAGLEVWANTESSGYNPRVAGGLNNPLNTTEGARGFVGQGGSQGNIKDFGTFEQGIDAQAYNLVHTRGAGYERIVDALRRGDEQGLFSAVDASAFGTHGLGRGSTPAGPRGTSSSSTPAQLTGIELNPLNWWGDLVSGTKRDIAKVGTTFAILAAGLALIVLGAWRSVSPHTQGLQEKAKDVAPVAAAAAI